MNEYPLPSVSYGRCLASYMLVYSVAVIAFNVVVGLLRGYGMDYGLFINIFLMLMMGGLYLVCAYIPLLVVLRIVAKEKWQSWEVGYHLVVMVLFVLLNVCIASGISPQTAGEHWTIVTLPATIVAGIMVCVRALSRSSFQ